MSAHWSERPEGGGRFAIWLIRTVGLTLGRPTARALLYPITLYFFLRRGPERRASRAWLTRVLGRPASTWQVLRHLHSFAATILDRLFLLSDQFRRFEVQVNGVDELVSRLQPQRGVLLLGAHVGSFEALRVLAWDQPQIDVRVVLDTQQTPALTQLLHALNPQIARNVIDASRPGHEIVLALNDAVHEGAVTTLLADRARPGENTVVVDFLGSPAHFPVAPFLIAAALKVPVVLSFGLYRGGNRYDLHFETFAETITLDRRARGSELQAIVQRFADRLEHHVRSAPYNWFNFYDFWNPERGNALPVRNTDVAVAVDEPRRVA